MPKRSRISALCLALSGLLLCTESQPAMADGPVRLHEFLLDSHVIRNSANTVRAPILARKLGANPVITPEYPWEIGMVITDPASPRYGENVNRVGLPTLFVDEQADTLRMLYWSMRLKNNKGMYSAAESTDGVVWERTWLDKFPYVEYPLTNLVLRNSELPAPYDSATSLWVLSIPNPELLPDSQYIGLLEMRDPRNTFIVTSPNGIDWQLDDRHMVIDRKNDTHSSIVFGPDGVYRAYIRRTDGAVPNRHRKVDVVESTDLVHWSAPRLLMDIGLDDQVYGLPVRELDGVYVSLMPVLHRENGTNVGHLDCEIVTSRDSLTFDRDFPGVAVLEHGQEGQWDYGMAYYNSGLVAWQGRWMAAYGGGARKHGSSSNLDIGMLEFDRGRLFQTTQDDPAAPALLETTPVMTGGRALLLNANIPSGAIHVGLVDAAGAPVDGYGVHESTLLPYDELRYRVAWPGNQTLPEAGEYGLLFVWDEGAALYAYELVTPPGDADDDGDVDDDDLAVLLANWGSPTAGWDQGEFNDTPPVNDDDLSLLLANWTGPRVVGAHAGGEVVPEPITIALLIAAMPVLRRRRTEDGCRGRP